MSVITCSTNIVDCDVTMEASSLLLRTPKRSALIWNYISHEGHSGDASVGVFVPYGTTYFRFFQAWLRSRVAQTQSVGPNMRQERTALIQSWLNFGRVRPMIVKLNVMATDIWERCNGQRTASDIIDQVAKVRKTKVEYMQAEALAFLQAAHAQGIINLDFPHSPAEGYTTIIRRELERGTLRQVICNADIAQEIEHLLNRQN
jgi:hypothetical protein